MSDPGFDLAAVDSVQSQLQSMHASMSPPEQAVLEAVLGLAAQGAGSATADERAIIIVGGKQSDFLIPLNPEVLAGLNPQPLPPHE